jgi:hypothetical protein
LPFTLSWTSANIAVAEERCGLGTLLVRGVAMEAGRLGSR